MVIKFKHMKTILYYIILYAGIISCKTEKKQIIQVSKINDTIEVNSTIIDSAVLQVNLKSLESELIGSVYSKEEGIKEFEEYYSGGAIIGEVFNNKQYTISSLSGKGDIVKYILFEESLRIKGLDGEFKILDVLDLTGEKYILLNDKDKNLHYHFCYKDDKNDQEIIAIAQYDENAEFLTKIYKAWRADRKTEKIIEIPVEGIKVENMDYGL